MAHSPGDSHTASASPAFAPEGEDTKFEGVKYAPVSKVARHYGLDDSTIRRWIALGLVPAVKVGARNPHAIRDNRPVRVPIDGIPLELIGDGAK